jgi:hypothetical protein
VLLSRPVSKAVWKREETMGRSCCVAFIIRLD